MADIAFEKRVTFNHTSAPDWAVTEPILDAVGPFARIDAVAYVHGPDGNRLSSRWVTLNRKTGQWHRGPVVRHENNLAQHVFKGHTADPEVSLFLDVWTDAGSTESPAAIVITATVDAWRSR